MVPHIASLGSSFAAGPWIPPTTGPRAAQRSSSNYAHLLAARLSAKLTDLSISGATLLTILEESQVCRGQTFDPQIAGLPGDADIVLVLGGGNDVGYVGGIFADAIRSYAVGRAALGLVGWWRGSGEVFPPTGVGEDELAVRYGVVLDALHEKAPRAKVFVIEYLTLLGDHVKPADVGFSEERIRYHQGVERLVQRATAKAAEDEERKAWCVRIPVCEKSRGHGIGSEEPWVVGHDWSVWWNRTAAFFHPNAAGMKAVADMIYQRLLTLKR